MASNGITISADEAKLRALFRNLRGIKGGMSQAAATAANATAKKLKVQISRKIRDRIAIKKQDVDPHIHIERASRSQPNPKATVTLSKTARLPLRDFGARQTSKGVTYKIEKGGQRKLARSAFGPKISRLGYHVFRRVGRQRLPIMKLRGPSPWGVFVKAGLLGETIMEARAEMDRQLVRAVRFLVLRKSGKI